MARRLDAICIIGYKDAMQHLGQETSLWALADGAFTIPAPVLEASGVPPGTLGPTPIFAFALSFGPELWLVDAGAGPCLGADGGGLPAAMAAAGLDPHRVTRVLLTHLHPDHAGGLSDEEGQPCFPGAEIVLSHKEWADWLGPGSRERQDEDAAQVAAWAERALSGYSLLRLEGGAELGRGVRAIPAPGHRPGHLAFRLDADGGGALFAGDVLHLPEWQLADPDRGLVWDLDAAAARVTRRRLLGLAADEGLLLAGAHLGPGGLARIEREGSGFRARPVP